MNEGDYISKLSDMLKDEKKASVGVPYKTPIGYFEQLSERINNKIEEDSDNFFENTLFNLDLKQPTYRVEDNYFEQFEGSLSGNIHKATVSNKFYINKWYKIAVAATIAIALTLGVIRLLDTPRNLQIVKEEHLTVPAMEEVSNTELSDFVDDAGETNVTISSSKMVEANQLFENVSSRDLQNFLTETAINESEVF